MAKSKILSDAEALERHVAKLRQDMGEDRGGWLSDRRLDWPTFYLAVIGAIVCIVVGALAWWPLGLASWKYWFPS
jgi:hypothetical protein